MYLSYIDVSYNNSCKLFTTFENFLETLDTYIYISMHANIPRVSALNKLCQIQFRNYRVASFCINFRTCNTSVSICSYVPASGALSFMFHVDGMLRGDGACSTTASGNKEKICKIIRIANSIARASSRIEWEARQGKTTSNNENIKKEESNPHDWSRNHGDIISRRCLQGNIESFSITLLQNSLRRMLLDAPCGGLLLRIHITCRRISAPVFPERSCEFALAPNASCTNPAGQYVEMA